MSSTIWKVFLSASFFFLTASGGLLQAATITVTNTNDSGVGSLRQAISDANTMAGSDIIEFNIPITDPNFVDVDSTMVGGDAAADVYVITPLSALPPLNDATGGTLVDGPAQTSFGGDTNPFGPEIVLDGFLAGFGVSGLTLTSDGNQIFGLNIQSFDAAAIFISGTTTGSNNNWVAANYVGTDATGTIARANNVGNFVLGAMPVIGESNIIGTNGDGFADDTERNVISGNNGIGVQLHVLAIQNVVAGNFIGTDRTGTDAIPNGRGVTMSGGAQRNIIGTNGDGVADVAERNIISGNGGGAVEILGDLETNENIVAGNFIGTDVTGTVALGNGVGQGINISSGGPNKGARNRIGTNGDGLADAAERNIISGNFQGVLIGGTGAEQNVVAGNYIGTDVTGTVAMSNLQITVTIGGGAHHNRVGTNGDGLADDVERNIISAGETNGVSIQDTGTDENVVAGNLIGTDVTGTVAMGNQFFGVIIHSGASLNRIGTNADGVADAAERNVISANGLDGVRVDGTGNVIAGNLIGTDVTGTTALANAQNGVLVNKEDNTIGGTTTGAGNTIAFNGLDGVFVAFGTGNAILSNSIFSNTNLGIDLGLNGVTLNDSGDGDAGPNNLQNFPDVTFATTGGVQGTLNSTPNTTFLLEFFANSACDSSGFGEGETFLGSTMVTTDGSGNTGFSAFFPVPLGAFVTATATDPDNNTSEFSECDVKIEDQDGDGIPDGEDACPNSNLSSTVVIDGCDSGVTNHLLEGGCTISDLIAECAAGANNHGQFVSCVSHLTNGLKKDGVITGMEKGAIESCAAQADIP